MKLPKQEMDINSSGYKGCMDRINRMNHAVITKDVT